MRGTQGQIGTHLCGLGIIPAYAGNTPDGFRRIVRAGDHPRVCGEHCRAFRQLRRNTGSSPRMRGTHDNFADSVAQMGIIPAYAENTVAAWRGSLPRRDHPRVCGEHTSSGLFHIVTPGSSPRMRGTRMRCVRHVSVGGDHPRVCGEHDRDRFDVDPG